jgi:putative ABC transport system ATP-binding protein
VRQLSGGEQQRVALVRAMLKAFNIYLADEPTGNLDEENKKVILDLMLKLKKRGKTIVCVTHDNDIAKSADRIISL